MRGAVVAGVGSNGRSENTVFLDSQGHGVVPGNKVMPVLPGQAVEDSSEQSVELSPIQVPEKEAGAYERISDNTVVMMQPKSLDILDDESTSEKQIPASRAFHVSLTVRFGGALLAFSAGIVNSVAFFVLSTFVSHTTGNMSKVAIGLTGSDRVDAADCSLLVMSFVIGSMTCGLLIGPHIGHDGLALYDVGLLIVSTLLVAAALTSEHAVARYFATAACGLQNGMTTNWGGAVCRTTHLTGLFTDVGMLLGRLLAVLFRKRCGTRFGGVDKVQAADDASKLSVLVTIAMSFFVGIIVGTKLFNAMEEFAFLVPATITGLVGLSYLSYRVLVWIQRVFSVETDCSPNDVSIMITPCQGEVLPARDASKQSQSD
eukprot:TRINITY_DN26822_c0_g1_i3.p1 TRINITY_DN26822_c0_g1~~TRINITY_DN26822_c0_g1_i3.p1  ORF type:complete len:373 (+),score=77.10 TRINITY_DN26822_c0_g1_i3:278-1396(+)